MADFPTLVATVFEVSLLLVGIVLLWRVALWPAIRRQPAPTLLERWDAPPAEFFLFLCLFVGGGATASLALGIFLKYHPLEGDAKIAVLTATTQVGMLAGIGV